MKVISDMQPPIRSYKWRKTFLSESYILYQNDYQIGRLREKFFSPYSYGILNGREYLFKTTGILKPRTEIIDENSGNMIGIISYNQLMNKAIINIENRILVWKYDNAWSTKWSINGSDGSFITYSSLTTKGLINTNSTDALLILSGLFVIKDCLQMTMALLAAFFIPLMISTLI